MQEAETKLLFDNGILTAAEIVRSPLSDSWIIQLHLKKGAPVNLDSQRSSPRSFKTLDAAFHVAHSIGFREVKVII